MQGRENASQEAGGVNLEKPRNKATKAQDHDKGDGRRRGLHLTGSVRIVGGDNQFTWCCDFNRQVYRGDGLSPKSQVFYVFFCSFLFFIILDLFRLLGRKH